MLHRRLRQTPALPPAVHVGLSHCIALVLGSVTPLSQKNNAHMTSAGWKEQTGQKSCSIKMQGHVYLWTHSNYLCDSHANPHICINGCKGCA